MSVNLSEQLKGELRLNEPMNQHTSWRIGGTADRFYKPYDITDLSDFIKYLPAEESLMWIGLGSNILVRDGGIRGTVVSLVGALNTVKLLGGGMVGTESGASCAKLSRFADKNGLSGLEFLSGIPGSVGGALAMNAGAFGSEIWSWVSRVTTIDRYGQLNFRYPEDFKIAYREVKPQFDGEWFVAAEFLLDAKTTKNNIKELLEERNSNQPIGLPSCGSVFKNPQGQHAAKLIDDLGLKGHCVNQACISDKHANFIINTGGAKARDVEDLIIFIQNAVHDKYGVLLQPEVKIVGENA